MTNLYETLGVERDADAPRIKKAYRLLAMQLHPDRAGGDAARFRAVQQAYEVLGDEERRARYDATGRTDPVSVVRQQAEQLVAQALVNAVVGVDEGRRFTFPVEVSRGGAQSPVEKVQLDLIEALQKDKRQAMDAQQKKATLEKAARKLRRTRGGEDLAAEGIRQLLITTDNYLAGNAEHQEMLVEALEVIKDYAYGEEAAPAAVALPA